jgi:hypothetical protein
LAGENACFDAAEPLSYFVVNRLGAGVESCLLGDGSGPGSLQTLTRLAQRATAGVGAATVIELLGNLAVAVYVGNVRDIRPVKVCCGRIVDLQLSERGEEVTSMEMLVKLAGRLEGAVPGLQLPSDRFAAVVEVVPGCLERMFNFMVSAGPQRLNLAYLSESPELRRSLPPWFGFAATAAVAQPTLYANGLATGPDTAAVRKLLLEAGVVESGASREGVEEVSVEVQKELSLLSELDILTSGAPQKQAQT